MNIQKTFPTQTEGKTATVFAGDYLNKLTGEAVERECKLKIDAASEAGANIIFSDVNENTIQLFEMLGVTNHVVIKE